jgi:hypothetical protein
MVEDGDQGFSLEGVETAGIDKDAPCYPHAQRSFKPHRTSEQPQEG